MEGLEPAWQAEWGLASRHRAEGSLPPPGRPSPGHSGSRLTFPSHLLLGLVPPFDPLLRPRVPRNASDSPAQLPGPLTTTPSPQSSRECALLRGQLGMNCPWTICPCPAHPVPWPRVPYLRCPRPVPGSPSLPLCTPSSLVTPPSCICSFLIMGDRKEEVSIIWLSESGLQPYPCPSRASGEHRTESL